MDILIALIGIVLVLWLAFRIVTSEAFWSILGLIVSIVMLWFFFWIAFWVLITLVVLIVLAKVFS